MHNIYFGESRLVISTEEELKNKEFTGKKLTISDGGAGQIQIREACKTFLSTAIDLALTASNQEELMNAVKKEFIVIKAGGGFVYTPEKKALLIFRRGKWDLPKGKLDEGETIEECSLREVEEETGVQHIKLENKLTITYHIYKENGETILKESHWYRMKTAQQDLIPQTEEDIEKCQWVAFKKLKDYETNMHPSIKDVIIKALT